MRVFEEMVKAGKVSVWIGNFTSEDDLVCYVDDGPFGLDFDFQVHTRLGRELCAEKAPLPVEKLVKGFSWWELFSEACIARAREIGITEAKCMVVFYTLEYMRSDAVNPNAPLKFIGSFNVRPDDRV